MAKLVFPNLRTRRTRTPLERQVVAGTDETPPGQRRLLRRVSWYWACFGLGLELIAVMGALVLLFAPSASGVFLFAVYAIPANSMLPVPHEPGLLYVAKYYHPLWLALAGTLGTGVAAFADYDLVARAMAHPRISGARDARLYKWAVRWLMARPFLTIVIFAAGPMPINVIRVLAPASGYPIGRYVAALMAGRFPRFFVLAWLGYVFQIPNWVVIVLSLMLLPTILMGFMRRPNPVRGAEDSDIDSTADTDADDDEEIAIPVLLDPDHPLPGESNQFPPRAE